MLWLILPGLALSSVALNLWQWYAGRRFPLHRSVANDFSPELSILRPLKGCDAETERCLESWFSQSYPAEVEWLFGVASKSDPVCDLVRRLMEKYPARSSELVICSPILGANGKVSTLCHLARRARFDHLVISDQDVWVPREFLEELVRPLRDETVGLVNCFYVLAGARGLGMWLEAVAVNADFWTQVLQGNMLRRMNFALGAAIGTRKAQLEKVGGFEPLLNQLADDYQLGNRVAKTGKRLELCPVPVECRAEAQSAGEVWRHQLRWSRTIRVCQPLPYFFSILGNATLWPLAFMAADRSVEAGALFVSALVVRGLTAGSNYRRLTRASSWRAAWLAPLKDLFHVLIWASAFLGNKISWRGERFRVDKGGKLTPLA